MKKLLLFIFLIPLFAFSQDTAKVEQYCILIVRQSLTNQKKITFNIDYGNSFSLEKAEPKLAQINDASLFTSTADAFNFLGRLGWIMAGSYATMLTDANTYHYIFRKIFFKKDL